MLQGISWPIFLVLLILKLTHVIGWSWLWVTSPLWLPLLVGGLLVAVGAVLVYLAKVAHHALKGR